MPLVTPRFSPAQKAEAEEVVGLIVEAKSTPKGEKKMEGAMYKAYHPKMVEATWWVATHVASLATLGFGGGRAAGAQGSGRSLIIYAKNIRS